MARIIDRKIESDSVNSSFSIWQIFVIGAILGILYWAITALFMRYTSSIGVAGDIATILIATIGLILLLNLHMTRPLLVVFASAVSLWGLSKLTDGLEWFEIILWSVLLYGLAYTFFFWLARYKRIMPVVLVAAVVVIIIRLTINL